MSGDASRPLQGVRVLDATNVLAGPFCCHQLAHLGADVIKIEAPGRGDLARRLGADEALSEQQMGASFLAQNAGKRSVVLDLKHPDGKAVFRRMAERSEVVVENFRPGVMDRLDLGWSALQNVNPKLIYCAISGYGQTGPMRALPAYDQIIQGVSGLMAVTGAPDTAPYRAGFPVCDTIGGLTAAMAICAALAEPKERRQGRFIDISMLEATIAAMGWVVSDWLIAGVEPAPRGNENATAAPSGAFATADGLLNIAANRQSQWEALARHIGCEALIAHPDYADMKARKANRTALKAELERKLADKPALQWADELNALGVPAGAVMTPQAILASEQIAARDLIASYQPAPGMERPLRTVRTGVKIDGQAPAVSAPPPRLGEHQTAVLAEFGYSPAEIEALRTRGAW